MSDNQFIQQLAQNFINPTDSLTIGNLAQLQIMLTSLDKLEDGYVDQALQFIADGSHAEILLSIQNHHNDFAKKSINASGYKHWSIHRPFYINMPKVFFPVQTLRYAKLLAAIDKLDNYQNDNALSNKTYLALLSSYELTYSY